MHANVLTFLLISALLTYGPGSAAGYAHEHAPHEQKVGKRTRTGAEQPFGREGDPRKVKRVISIDMSDTMRFFPSELRVKRGETVRFVVRNGGQIPHEMVIGTMEELKKHAALMKKNGDMHAEAHGHGPNATHAAPGVTSRLVWQFTRPGEFHYACLVPGHFEAGMIGTIVVR